MIEIDGKIRRNVPIERGRPKKLEDATHICIIRSVRPIGHYYRYFDALSFHSSKFSDNLSIGNICMFYENCFFCVRKFSENLFSEIKFLSDICHNLESFSNFFYELRFFFFVERDSLSFFSAQ